MDTDFENAQQLVQATIRKLGLDPTGCRAHGNETQEAWTLKRGSASVLVTVTYHEDEKRTYLRVASLVVTLPTNTANHPALFRRLLELNAAGLANAAFGLAGDRVVAVSERPAQGLGPEEVEQIVRHLVRRRRHLRRPPREGIRRREGMSGAWFPHRSCLPALDARRRCCWPRGRYAPPTRRPRAIRPPSSTTSARRPARPCLQRRRLTTTLGVSAYDLLGTAEPGDSGLPI